MLSERKCLNFAFSQRMETLLGPIEVRVVTSHGFVIYDYASNLRVTKVHWISLICQHSGANLKIDVNNLRYREFPGLLARIINRYLN